SDRESAEDIVGDARCALIHAHVGIIEEKEVGLQSDGPGEGKTFPIPVGKVGRQSLPVLFTNVSESQSFFRPLSDPVTVQLENVTVIEQRELHIGVVVEVGPKSALLKNEAGPQPSTHPFTGQERTHWMSR